MLSKFIERDADKISTNKMKIEELKKEYDKLQIKYGAKQLDSIYNGGCEENPNVCFVFMNPTGKILQVISLGKEENHLGLEQRIYGNYFIK